MKNDPTRPSGYQTQSSDTSFEAEQILIEGYRKMSIAEKMRRIAALNRAGYALSLAGIRARHPNTSDREILLRLAALRLDRETMVRIWGWDPESEGY
jgi:hypothetical protein